MPGRLSASINSTNSPLTALANCLLFDLLGSTELNNLSHVWLVINNVTSRLVSCLGDILYPFWMLSHVASKWGLFHPKGYLFPAKRVSSDRAVGEKNLEESSYKQMCSFLLQPFREALIIIFLGY